MRKWSPLIAVCLGTFMLLIDVSIVIVALPSMAGSLHSSLADLQWVLDGYALALGALLLGTGSVADRFGRRRVYLAGLVVFALASLACAVAPTPGLLIASRVAQGIGGAAMYALTIALLNIAYRGRDRGVAFGVWGAVSGLAAASGPIAGGLLTEHLNWRWIFLVNLPISVLAVAFTLRGVAESRNPRAVRVDGPGVAAFTIGAACLTYTLIKANERGWASAGTLVPLAVSVLALIGFVLIERATAAPMLDLALFRRPAFAGIMLGGLLLQGAAFGYLPYTSVWLQEVLHRGPVDAGLLGSLPMSLAAFVVAAATGRLLHDARPHLTVGCGLLLIGAGDLLQSVVHAGSASTVLVPGLIVAGLGVGLASPSISAAALSAAPVERAGMAGGAINTFRQLGFTLGVAVFGAVYQANDGTGAEAGLRAALITAGVAGLVGGVVVLGLVGRGTRRPAPVTTEPALARTTS